MPETPWSVVCHLRLGSALDPINVFDTFDFENLAQYPGWRLIAHFKCAEVSIRWVIEVTLTDQYRASYDTLKARLSHQQHTTNV